MVKFLNRALYFINVNGEQAVSDSNESLLTIVLDREQTGHSSKISYRHYSKYFVCFAIMAHLLEQSLVIKSLDNSRAECRFSNDSLPTTRRTFTYYLVMLLIHYIWQLNRKLHQYYGATKLLYEIMPCTTTQYSVQ